MLVAENMSKEEMVKEAVEEAKAKAAKETGEQEEQAEETVEETAEQEEVSEEAEEASEEEETEEGSGFMKKFGRKNKKDKKDEKIEELTDRLTRQMAEFDNFRKRTDKSTPFAEGMEKIYKQLMTTLEEIGVKPIEAVGQEFDPDFHNAVMHVEDEEVGENIITEEFQKGYLYRDSVVRHSMIKVAN